MNTTKSFTSLPDQSAFFADILAKEPDIAALLTAAYGSGNSKSSGITTTRTANVESTPLMGIKPGGLRRTGKGSRGGKVKEKSEKPPPRALVNLVWRPNGPGAQHFLDAVRDAGMVIKCYDADGINPETGETHFAGDPILDGKDRPVRYFDATFVRRDEWAALDACFIGSIRGEAHGTQLDQARQLAYTAIRRDLTGTVVRRPFHYTDIAGNATTVVNMIAHTGIVPSSHPWRSPAGHSAKWSADGYVSGLPHPIQKLLRDLSARERLATTEMINLGKLRKFAVAGDQDGYEKLILEEYPKGKEMEPIFAEDGITPKDYTVVSVEHPVVQALRREKGSSLLDAIAKLEAHAGMRLAEIQKDIDGLGSNPSPETVERTYTAMLNRGSIQTLEESLMSCYDYGSRQYYSLPVGTVINATPVERAMEKREETALWLTK